VTVMDPAIPGLMARQWPWLDGLDRTPVKAWADRP
jgi:hypothetical protein